MLNQTTIQRGVELYIHRAHSQLFYPMNKLSQKFKGNVLGAMVGFEPTIWPCPIEGCPSVATLHQNSPLLTNFKTMSQSIDWRPVLAFLNYIAVERIAGFEPVPPAWKAGMLAIKHHIRIFGSSSRARTCDTSVNSRMLYLLSYRGI